MSFTPLEDADDVGRRGTSAATALAVREVAKAARTLGFHGRTPNLSREVAAETVHLVNLQRVVAGVTGRDPGFTVNLYVVHGALRRAWRDSGHWLGERPVRSGGVTERLGGLAFGYDHWWHPNDEDEAYAAAVEVGELLRTRGEEWLLQWTDPTTALDRLCWWEPPLPTAQLAGALLVERPADPRRGAVAETLEYWQRWREERRRENPDGPPPDDDDVLNAWLIRHLTVKSDQLMGDL